MAELHELRQREAELTEQIEREREKDDTDAERLDDLHDQREEVRADIAEAELAFDRAEQA